MVTKALCSCFVLSFILVALFGSPCLAESTIVSIEQGAIRGEENDSFRVYKGIPYAKPPVGPLRWAAPEPAPAWNGILDTHEFKEPCPYLEGLFLPLKDESDFVGNEDCLYLNVWTPRSKDRPKIFPVMVFIHGGAFELGGTNQKMFGQYMYDGALLAGKGEVVVVTISYRLGALGFLAHPALGKNPAGGPITNFGLQDQLMALKWVKKNIAAFKGDSSRVTIFGESAGAMSVCALLTSPVVPANLFQGAIQQSGGCFSVTEEAALASGAKFANQMGCPASLPLSEQAACLRRLDAKQIVLTQPSMFRVHDDPSFLSPLQSVAEFFDESISRQLIEGTVLRMRLPILPVVDGWFIPKQPVTLISQKKSKPIPIVLGHTPQEVPEIAVGSYDETSFTALVKKEFPRHAAEILAYYSEKNFGSLKKAISTFVTDVTFTCPAREEALELAKAGNTQVYKYVFEHPIGWFRSGFLGGPVHGSDLPFLFFDFSNAWPLMRSESYTIQDMMLRYWTSFAAFGSPNMPGLEPWPSFDDKDERHLYFEESVLTGARYHAAQCKLLE